MIWWIKRLMRRLQHSIYVKESSNIEDSSFLINPIIFPNPGSDN